MPVRERFSIVRRVSTPAQTPEWGAGSYWQYLNTLKSRFAVAVDRLNKAERKKKRRLIEQISQALDLSHAAAPADQDSSNQLTGTPDASSEASSDVAWQEANRAEQVLCFLLKGPQLDGELMHQLLEAEEKRLRGFAVRRLTFGKLCSASAPGDAESRKQSLLYSIVVDLHSEAEKRHQIKEMQKRAVLFVMWAALFIVIMISAPFVLYAVHFIYNEFYLEGNITQSADSVVSRFVASFPNFGLFTALSFGALGAVFSRFLILQRVNITATRADAATYYSRRYIVLRIFIGTVGAIVVYFFLAADLIHGPLVPDIEALTFKAAHGAGDGTLTYLGTRTSSAMVPSKDVALLIVWAFLAGFSEQLVPGLLAKTSESAVSEYQITSEIAADRSEKGRRRETLRVDRE